MSEQGQALEAFAKTDLIRQVEVAISERYHPSDVATDSPMKNPVHLSIGQEHIPVAIRMAIGDESHAYATHRAHAAYLAWNGDVDAMIAELHGKVTGCANGWGGSMHLIDEDAGFMGTSAIVGSSLSYAVGLAFGKKLLKDETATVAFVGDAVPETGQFWEALNFASLKNINLMVVIENNELATATTRSDRQPKGRGLLAPILTSDLISRENFANISGGFVEADSFGNIYKTALEMIQENNGLKVLWVDTCRMAEHVGPNYNLTSNDRLTEIRKRAVKLWDEETVQKTEERNGRKVDVAFIRAARAPWPPRTWDELGAPTR